jgi:hypothetical protein
MRRILSVVGVGFGTLILAFAGVVHWAIAPALAVLPANTNTTLSYTGTAAVLLNAEALTTPGQPVLITNVPITLTHTTKVLNAHGANALVSDGGTVNLDGKPVADYQYRYAVNRTTMDRGSGYGDVVNQRGVTFNWPIRTAPKDYTAWIPDTQGTTPLRYTGKATRAEIATYVYTADLPATPITDPATLKELPASLPKATVAELAKGLGLDATTGAQLQQVLAAQPDPVPFHYTYAMKATFWVEPSSGEIVDLEEHEVRTLGFDVAGQFVPVTPVMDIGYKPSADSLAAAAKAADKDGGSVRTIYVGLPLACLILGGSMLVAGVAGLYTLRRRRPGGHRSDVDRHDVVTPAEPASELEPV